MHTSKVNYSTVHIKCNVPVLKPQILLYLRRLQFGTTSLRDKKDSVLGDNGDKKICAKFLKFCCCCFFNFYTKTYKMSSCFSDIKGVLLGTAKRLRPLVGTTFQLPTAK